MTPTDSLAGRIALVCGGTGSIGAAVAGALAAQGAAVAVHYAGNAAAAERLAASLPGRAAAVQADLTSLDGARAAIAATAAALGASPGIVVNAASTRVGPVPVADLDDAGLEANLDALRIHVNICRAALPGMRAAGWGRIVLVSGALGTRHSAGFGMYAAVKAGANALSRTLAIEEGRHGITVNVVAPGRVLAAGEDPGDVPPAFAGLAEVMRLSRGLPADPTPQDVATSVAFLACPAASAVTGQVVYLAAGEPI